MNGLYYVTDYLKSYESSLFLACPSTMISAAAYKHDASC